MSDLSFRRHICVQALILADFLLSLTPQAKARLANLNSPNKSVQYQYTLSDEDVCIPPSGQLPAMYERDKEYLTMIIGQVGDRDQSGDCFLPAAGPRGQVLLSHGGYDPIAGQKLGSVESGELSAH